MTRVSVPDSGTLLLGGQRITVEVDKEAGVPILSKIPILGRLFSNRSKVKDHKILLILVKPTIILQEEREAEAIAALESES
jgi:type II secretory pathway component GspD/PulD (secretin)